MAGSAVLEDGSVLSRVDQGLTKIERFFAVIAGVCTLALMALAVISVGGRELFEKPLPGYVDWISQILPLIAFLGLSYTQRFGGHIRMDIFIGRFKGRAFWITEAITTLLALGIILLLVWGAWSHFDRSFDWSAPLWSRDSTIDINLPIWPTKIMVPIMFGLLCIRLILQITIYINAFINNIDAPAGVPLMQSVADQAAAEASMVVTKGDHDGAH